MTVQEFYQRVEGDYQDMLTRLPTDDLMLKFLQKYAGTDDFEAMLAAYAKKDYRELFSTSHNLKGMAANMGLTKVFEPASAICEAVRHGNPTIDLAPLVEKTMQEQKRTLLAIQELVASQKR